ncbi:lytic transglycosylase domain-containing protein [Caulobacter segnis]|uniref:Lytic transglycosylase n=1 Tax=Caulobacter segnis TaxID=88688 RepID=A0A2W5WJW5_9CAUL|nr:lytic transglycosylase domain-containing protein [Caulobacter segnis]PZR34108.1 MAG: lytic transglycosylase [Caulobacter segnis]
MPVRLGLSLFGRSARSFLVPAKTALAVARRRGQGRPDGRRALRASLDGDEHGRTLVVVGLGAKTSRARRASAIASTLAICLALVRAAAAQAHFRGAEQPELGLYVAEASRVSGLPETWIRAIARVESGGAAWAISPKGAMGMMQIMPGTWRELQADLALGGDPFDQRDNLVAGAVYLRRMFDRFGEDGFLAAYNAGPARYQAFLDGRKSLPPETIAYIARVRASVGRMASAQGSKRAPSVMGWRASGLFVGGAIASPKVQSGPLEAPLFAPFTSEAGR